MRKKIVIFKNDRIGDLIWSLDSLNFINQNNKDKDITYFLSNINFSMNFLVQCENVEFRKINYHPNFLEKLSIIKFFLTTQIHSVYIFRPQSFYYLLPIIFFFKKIKFNGFCINDKNNYKRPNKFLRIFLNKIIINDRSSTAIKPHTAELQNKLVDFEADKYNKKKYSLISNHHSQNKYILFQFKKKFFDFYKWEFKVLVNVLNQLSIYNLPIYLIKDKEHDFYNKIFKSEFNYYNFKTKEKITKSSNVHFFDEIEGLNYFSLIYNSSIVIAPHGTVTSVSNLNSKSLTIDLFFLDKKKIDFYEIKNSFHEFKPKNKNYKFMLISNNYHKWLKKVDILIKNYTKHV